MNSTRPRPKRRKALGERSKRFWNTVSRRFGVVGLILTFWGLFLPFPLPLVASLLALSPVAAILISRASHGKIAPTDEPANGSGLVTLLIMPPIALALIDLRFFPPVSGWRLLAFGLALGLLLGLLYLWIRPLPETPPRVRTWERAIGWIGAGAYGWSVLAAFNGLLPQGAPTVFERPVLAERVSAGKSVSYYLRLPPLGSVAQSEDWSVSRRVYNELKVGDHVCMIIHEGALHEAWYEPQLCPAALAR